MFDLATAAATCRLRRHVVDRLHSPVPALCTSSWLVAGPPALKRKRREHVNPDVATITYLQRAWRKRMMTLATSTSPAPESSAIASLLCTPVLTSDLLDASNGNEKTDCSDEEDSLPLR